MAHIKKITAFILMISLISVFPFYGFASGVTAVEETDGKKQFVKISGTTEKAFENVSVQVLNSAVTSNMTEAEYNAASIFNISVTSKINKEFEINFIFPDDSPAGKYIVNVKAENSPKIPFEINLISLSEINAQLVVIKTSDNEADVLNAISKYYDKLGIILSNPALITTATVKLFIANRKASKKDDFEVSEISSLIAEAIAVYDIQSSTGDTIAANLLKYDSFLELSNGTAYKYFEPTADEINLVNSYLLTNSAFDYTSFSTLKTEYQAQMLRVLMSRDRYAVKEILTDYGAELNADLTAYNSISNNKKDSVALALYNNKNIYSKALFQSALNTAVANASGDSGTRDSISGGGGGGTVSITQAPVLPVIPLITPEPICIFSDVEELAPWAVEAVNALFKSEIISMDSQYRPNNNVTREEFAKLVVLMAGIDIYESDSDNNEFSDVNAGDWFMPYVLAAKKHGIVEGIDNISFGVGQNITRQDMAVMIYRALSLMEFNGERGGLGFFDNTDISDYATEAVEYLSNNKIINGSDGYFYPKNYSTRAEAAQIIYNALYR